MPPINIGTSPLLFGLTAAPMASAEAENSTGAGAKTGAVNIAGEYTPPPLKLMMSSSLDFPGAGLLSDPDISDRRSALPDAGSLSARDGVWDGAAGPLPPVRAASENRTEFSLRAPVGRSAPDDT